MSIRIPSQSIKRFTTTDLGAASVAGGVPFPLQIPQDTDNVVMKLTASVVGGTVSAVFQTSDDGGSTYYDVVRTPATAVANNTVALWANVPVLGSNSMKIIPGSIAGGSIGSAAASTLAANSASGLPILGIQNRVFVIYTGNLTTNNGVNVDVIVNNQSATA